MRSFAKPHWDLLPSAREITKPATSLLINSKVLEEAGFNKIKNRYKDKDWRITMDQEYEFKQYRRKQIAELADWVPGFPMSGVSISDSDKANGSPKTGDKIARNLVNHDDKWLVAQEYFKANFEPIKK